jgi:RNA polymerase sigma-70 factor (ECF subfamily)
MAAPAIEQVAVLEAAGGERDRRLAMAVRTGDEAAFRELYEAYRDRIWTFIVYSTGDACQAQDILQTVFLKAFRGLGGFRFRSSLFTWIYRIARNECRNYHRRRGVPPMPLEAILGSRDEIDGGSGLKDPDMDRAVLRTALLRLSPKLREVVVLRYLEGLSYDEISRVLGRAPGTVASRLNRALSELEVHRRPFRGSPGGDESGEGRP